MRGVTAGIGRRIGHANASLVDRSLRARARARARNDSISACELATDNALPNKGLIGYIGHLVSASIPPRTSFIGLACRHFRKAAHQLCLLSLLVYSCGSGASSPAGDTTGTTGVQDAQGPDTRERTGDIGFGNDARFSADQSYADLPDSDSPFPGETTEIDLSDSAGNMDLKDLAGMNDFTGADSGDFLPSGTGMLCDSDEDCDNGICIDTMFGRFCIPPYGPECPVGWTTLQSGGQEYCVPSFPSSCKPCKSGLCPKAWCREIGAEGDWCLAPCAQDLQCEDGFECVWFEEDNVRLCVPLLPSCVCAEADIGSYVACKKTNEFGTCTGAGLCTEDAGLAECSASVAQAEICDGADNDCDNLVDEDYPDKGKPCDGPDPDHCMVGLLSCAGNGAELVCSGDVPQTEKCDGKDNDCDGEIDENFPKKGQICGVSPLCGEGYFECTPSGNRLECVGVAPQLEVCDGKDNDCDGETDNGFPDDNGNGVADCLE